MLKICDSSICRPLEITYKSCVEQVNFPQEWKKAIVCFANKKNGNSW